MAIIISRDGKNAKRIDKSDFAEEDQLQQYIYANPESIPLYDIKEDIRLLLLGREFPTDSGPIDAIGIDKDGDIYCVETKLYKNPDKRLVVAQVLDYGASLWRSYQDFSEFTGWMEREANKTFRVSVSQRIKDFFVMEDDDVTNTLHAVKRNLNAGKIKFVVLMDQLHDPLKNLIVFLNQSSRFDIYAVEMEFYQYEAYEIMIPRLFGAEVKKDVDAASQSPRRAWDENSFLTDLKTKNVTESDGFAIKKLLNFSRDVADELSWGTGVTTASFSAKFRKIARGSLYTVRSDGIFIPNFGWLSGNEKSEMYRDEFAKDLRNIPGLNIPESYEKFYPATPVAKWSPFVDRIIQAVQRLLSIQG